MKAMTNLTKEEILEMLPSREMDALIWKYLHGQDLSKGTMDCRYVDGDVQPCGEYPLGHISPPHYSSNIRDAWYIIEFLQKKYLDYSFYIEAESQDNSFWFRVNDTSQGGWNRDGQWNKRVADASANSLPVVISRVALLIALDL